MAISIRQQIFSYMNLHPEDKPRHVKKAFSEVKPVTIKNYLQQWRDFKKNKDLLDIAKQKKDISKKKKILPLPKNISFERFCTLLSYPEYYGLFQCQKEAFEVVWNNKFSKVIKPRDHGKSILWGNVSQWAMQYENYDVLYLGWTDRRKEVAENVFNFFKRWDLLDDVKSEYHFRINNGGRFDTYSITSKDILGKHSVGKTDRLDKLTEEDLKDLDEEFTEAIKELYLKNRNLEHKLLIFIDDPIDETFRLELWKEAKVEMKYRSTIANINPDKFIFSGTRKFEEDFFYFLDLTYGDKLASYVRRTHLCTPFLEDIFPKIDFSKLDKEHRLYPELIQKLEDQARDDPCYNPYLEDREPRYLPGRPPAENLLCPERWSEEGLNEKREEIGEYDWFAEYEGNPHPITGEVWSEVCYVPSIGHWQEYDMAEINVDRATTQKKKSSLTGITVVLREKDTGQKLVIKDLSGKYKFDDALDLVEEQYKWLRNDFLNVRIIIVIEKQGGGDDFIDSAESRGYAFANHIVPITSRRDKIERIKDYLEIPVKRSIVKFLDTLRNSELIKEILDFPYPAKLDAIDSLATGIKVFEDYPLGNIGEKLEGLTMHLKSKRLKSERLNTPIFNNPIQNPNYYKRKRGGW